MTTKEFIAKLNCEEGAAVIEKIQTAGKDPDAVYAIAKEAGVTDSFDVFKAEMTAYYEATSQELSEDELSNVAGGDWTMYGTAAMIGVHTVALASACAAI